MFIDSANIMVRSGKGGDGCVAFLRAKYVEMGGPCGGDGGNGGNVILVADTSVETLMDFAGRHHWFAPSGEQGGNKSCHGKKGQHLEIHLPVGTLVYNNPPHVPGPPKDDSDDPDRIIEQFFLTGIERAQVAAIRSPQPGEKPTGELMIDLNTPGMRYVIAKGGRGGFGNEHFKSPTHQAPREASPGETPQEFYLRLELKLIADIGLLGKPNAGKSTFLASISAAEPKIADYPFTTLKPQLGIAELGGGRRLVVADIPGLIENAHKGTGLGMRFLKHVERTRVLLHLIEMEPTDRSDPVENYRVIRNELKQHSAELYDKPEIVVISKTDLLGSDKEDAEIAAQLISQAIGKEVLTMSSATGEHREEVLDACWIALGENRRQRPNWPLA